MFDEKYQLLEEELKKMSYMDVDSKTELYSAEKTKELNAANNLGAALFASKRLHEINGHDPKILFTLSYMPKTLDLFFYAAAAYGSSEGMRSFAKTNTSLLENCLIPQFQKEDLANAYAFSLIENKFTPNSWSVIYLSDTTYDWENSEKNISGMFKELLTIHQAVGNFFR